MRLKFFSIGELWLPFYFNPFTGVLFGLIIGSFVATLAIRWPQGRSVLKGRSRCDNCDRQLSATELVPVIGFLLSRGKCRTCGAAIVNSHIAIELTAGLIGGLALIISPDPAGLAGAIFGWILLLTLAVLDTEHHWLPDRLTGTLAATGLLAAFVTLSPSIVERLLGGFAGYAILIILALAYRTIRGREGLGGGDPKMLGAIGCWLGWQALPLVLLGASLVGVASVLVQKMSGKKVAPDTQIPLGSLMAVSAFPIWLLQSAGIILTV